jgi:hypothetical protein
MGETAEIRGLRASQVQDQMEMSEQAGAPVIWHWRPRVLVLVPDAGRYKVVRDHCEDVSHAIIVEMTTRGFSCMYVVFLAAGSLNRSHEYPIQADYASTNAILRILEPLLRTTRATGSTAGHR